MVAIAPRIKHLEQKESFEKSALIEIFCSKWFVYIDEPLMMQIDSAGTKTKFYFGQTTNYNTEVVFDESGEVVERYEIEPFGEFKIYDGMTTNELTTSKVGNEYVFQGRRFDSESGLYYFRYRYYSPKMERFISRDPLRYRAGDINLYRFVGNNPFRWVDPLGLQANNFVCPSAPDKCPSDRPRSNCLGYALTGAGDVFYQPEPQKPPLLPDLRDNGFKCKEVSSIEDCSCECNENKTIMIVYKDPNPDETNGGPFYDPGYFLNTGRDFHAIRAEQGCSNNFTEVPGCRCGTQIPNQVEPKKLKLFDDPKFRKLCCCRG